MFEVIFKVILTPFIPVEDNRAFRYSKFSPCSDKICTWEHFCKLVFSAQVSRKTYLFFNNLIFYFGLYDGAAKSADFLHMTPIGILSVKNYEHF